MGVVLSLKSDFSNVLKIPVVTIAIPVASRISAAFIKGRWVIPSEWPYWRIWSFYGQWPHWLTTSSKWVWPPIFQMLFCEFKGWSRRVRSEILILPKKTSSSHAGKLPEEAENTAREVTKYKGSGAQQCGFESWFHHLLAVCPSSSIK